MKTTTPKFDTASQAALLAAVVRAQRIPCCPLCADPRRIALVDGVECRVCSRCGDVEPCPDTCGASVWTGFHILP